MRSRLLIPVFALALVGAIASCDNDITNISEGFDDAADWRADLDAAQETPTPTLTGGATPTGRAWIIDNGTTLTYHMEYEGLTSNANNAHIHRGAPGQAGNAVVQLVFLTQREGVVSGTVDMTVADVGLGAENVSPDSLRTLLDNGNAYINIHTATNGAGEIRGQVRRN
jgi:hypothetical protein